MSFLKAPFLVLAALLFCVAFSGLLATRVSAATGRFTVVLDAGHGGSDPGALDVTGAIYEADINQRVTDELARLLREDGRFDVVLTHEPGTNPGINQRAAVAGQTGADLLLSLHLNANSNDLSARGFQVFPALPHTAHGAESLRAAGHIAGRMREAGAPPLDGDGVYYAMYAGSSTKQFYLAADHTGGLPYQGKTYGVVEYAGVPALLIEQWYITNEDDMLQFNHTEGIALMASAIYQGIVDYAGV